MNAGGVAHGGTIVFASTGYAEVVAIDSTSGAILWRQRLNAPIRSAPTVSNGRVFVVTMENELFALSVADGSRQWSHAGFDETLTIAGGASPAVSNNVVVAAYSSGELVGLRADNGRVLWSENLGSLQIRTGASGLADIIGHPVIDRDMVFAISHNRRMVAIDTRTGRRVWSQPISSLQTPWVAGQYIYVLTSDAQILCLTRETGQIVWVTQLDAFEKPNDRRNPIVWTGPVLGGDRLIVTSSTRIAMSVSPYTGKILGEIKLPNTLAASPIIANSTLYLLTERGQLLAFR
jgi:outer membrane protein assembly factor BamB